jgi:hypothetical protein
MEWEENGELHQDCGYGITSASGISKKLKHSHWDFITECEESKWAFPNCAPVCSIYAKRPDEETTLAFSIATEVRHIKGSIKSRRPAWPSTESEEIEESERRNLAEVVKQCMESSGIVFDRPDRPYVPDLGEFRDYE